MMGEILFIAHRIPFPPDRGDKIRSWNILRRLAELAPVHVAGFADDERDMGFVPELARVTVSHFIVPRTMSRIPAVIRGLWRHEPLSVSLFSHAGLKQHILQLLKERPISAVFVYSVQMAQYVPVLGPDVRFVMDFCDLDSAKFAAYGAGGSGPMAWVHRREGRKLLGFERETAARADASLFVSEAEAALFREKAGAEFPVQVLENGVDLTYFSPSADFQPLRGEGRGKGPLLVFTGQMDYQPNVEAVDHFARHCLPLVRDVFPATRFAIVGRRPSPAVRALAGLPGVIVTGEVPDVRGWLAAADAVVAPLRLARGIQNKVLEAMAMARPVVASHHAAEGIDAVPGRDLLLAADRAAAAGAIIELLSDGDRAERLGRAARARVEQRYSWQSALAPLAALVGLAPAAAGRAKVA